MEYKYASKIKQIWVNKNDYPRININFINENSIVLSENIEEAVQLHSRIIKKDMEKYHIEENYKDIWFEIKYEKIYNNMIKWLIVQSRIVKLEE